MDQDPVQAPSESNDAKPKIFQNINGVIAGITGLVIALGGLVAATQGIWDKEPEQAVDTAQAQSQTQPQVQLAATTTEKPPVAAPTAYKGRLYNADTDTYDGAPVVLVKDGSRWVLTASDVDYPYDEINTSDKSVIIAKSTEYTSKLRWPVEGGLLKESTTAGRDDWQYYADIKPLVTAPSN